MSGWKDGIKVAAGKLLPGLIVWQGGAGGGRVALTFDDGPDAEHTPRVLDTLDRWRAPATFFLIGSKAEKRPDLVVELARRGHEIGSHSYSHPKLEQAPGFPIAGDIDRAQSVLASILGAPPRHYRPPYGVLTLPVFGHCWRRKLRMVLWSLDTGDFSSRPLSTQAVVERTRPGGILLLHDNRQTTPALLEQYLPALLERGLRFVTVSQLLNESAPAAAVIR